MTFEQFYLGCLAHASYLIGSEGIAAVVDPQRDVGIYLETAQQHGLRIAYIVETHLHADFVSGHRELAQRTGATICLGAGSGATFPHRAVHDGDEIEFGRCRLRFVETPGHTLESISVVVTDLESGPGPAVVLTGDTLFIGDVGRPDLAESHTPQELAGLLYDSLHRKLLVLPDDVRVYPAHGAGSLCGRNISADRSSTIGRERISNYALQPMAREQFVQMMTQDLPARPDYFQRDVDANRRGAPSLDSLPPVAALAPAEVLRRQQDGVTVLDTRAATYYCPGHVPSSLNIGLGGQFAAWAGSVVGLDRELILVAEDDQAAEEARLRLARVGIERVAGKLQDGIAGWAGAGLPLAEIQQIAVQDLEAERAGNPDLCVVDVRREAEWNQGRIPGAVLRPLDRLRTGLTSLDPEKLTAVQCKSGYRSAIACSLLEAHGFKRVMNVLGGFDAWTGAGLATVK
ncbi:MAG: MBL fold metallo-hydrolase [Acidobacteriia bacterium]|nr:MBL fold metallo-hydrolase [Terriglobia bacterium]